MRLFTHKPKVTVTVKQRVPTTCYPTAVGSTIFHRQLRTTMASCKSMPISPAASAVSKASFSLVLGALTGSTSPQGCFLSPLSIVYALSLALNGAGPKSPTHAELLRVIAGDNGHVSESELNSELGRAMALMNGQCASKNGPSSEMVLANSLWTRGMTLKKAYVDSMKSLFQATASEAINGAKDINDWVEGATRGMIKDLIQTENFHAVLANAIYFKGLWEHAFKPELTQQGEFTTHSGQPKMVPMMHQLFDGPAKTLKGVRKEGLYDAISLPYKGDVFSAVALLPAVGVDMATAFEDWARGPQEFQPIRRVKIVMPKFKVSSQLSLKPVLKEMGVEVAFTVAADFTRMADGGLFISDVVHKAVVEVDEEGTVAAAATAVMMLRCVPAPPEEIIFNRPFAFMIYHNPTNLPAFVGVVHDPVAA